VGSRPSSASRGKSGRSAPRPDRPLARIAAEVGGDERSLELCAAFLGTEGYSPRLAARLLEVAAGRAGDPWEVRRLAALMLQQQMLRLPAGNLPELDRLLVRLGLKQPGIDEPLRPSVLLEGYTRRDLPGFARQLRRRLERARRVLDGIGGPGTTPGAVAVFVAFARRECKLALARYLFTPEEVVARILAQVEVSRGMLDPFPAELPYVQAEASQALAGLPPYEAAILRLLIGSSSGIYWVSQRTGRELNSLVEYPLDTVVLVVKPPGSELEIEIKRAGCRGRPLLGAVFERGGAAVPPSHRLDGGSMLTALHWDARACSLLATVHRRTHGGKAPLPHTLALMAIYGIPLKDEEVHVLDYFTEARHFGPGFAAMRKAMAASAAAFRREHEAGLPELPGDLALTSRFLNHAPPGQAILAGTSSFRLDRLALYLSERGPAAYFSCDLETKAEPAPLRQLADDLLEEILGTHVPPAGEWAGYARYLAAAFALPPNRIRADRTYCALMRQLGVLWGTLWALSGYTRGESFVGRNVGLKSRWDGGRWRVEIISMDHDNLQVDGHEPPGPLERVWGLRIDDIYVMGRRGIRGSTGLLREIYRAGEETARQGLAGLRRAMAGAYRRTLRVLRADRQLRRLVSPALLRETADWEAVVRHYLRRDPAPKDAWKERVRRRLARRGLSEPRIDAYLEAVEAQGRLLETFASLYLPGGRRQTPSGAPAFPPHRLSGESGTSRLVLHTRDAGVFRSGH